VLRQAGAPDVVWVQEEPRNMGAWTFVRERIDELLGPAARVRYVGRPRAASPATGSQKRHAAEQQELVAAAFAAPSGDVFQVGILGTAFRRG
jgi:2-oxoglutarate dehydrogenase E1 component